jgi:hypothetical protein
MYNWDSVIWVLIPIVALVGAFASGIVATLSRARVRELEIRERIAMIEKGLVPPPEVDPGGFDRAMSQYGWRGRVSTRGSGRHRRAGITLIGVGVGLMFLIGYGAGAAREGVGVGGFLAVIGLAFLINSLFETYQSDPASAGSAAHTAPQPPRQ